MLSQSQKKPKVNSAISQHLLRSHHNFYSRTLPEHFTCEKNAGLTGLVSLPTQKQQRKLLPQCHINRSWVTILKETEVRDCMLGPFNPSSGRRPKKGHTGIKSYFTKLFLLSHKELSEIQILLSYRQADIRCHSQSLLCWTLSKILTSGWKTSYPINSSQSSSSWLLQLLI